METNLLLQLNKFQLSHLHAVGQRWIHWLRSEVHKKLNLWFCFSQFYDTFVCRASSGKEQASVRRGERKDGERKWARRQFWEIEQFISAMYLQPPKGIKTKPTSSRYQQSGQTLQASPSPASWLSKLAVSSAPPSQTPGVSGRSDQRHVLNFKNLLLQAKLVCSCHGVAHHLRSAAHLHLLQGFSGMWRKSTYNNMRPII